MITNQLQIQELEFNFPHVTGVRAIPGARATRPQGSARPQLVHRVREQ